MASQSQQIILILRPTTTVLMRSTKAHLSLHRCQSRYSNHPVCVLCSVGRMNMSEMVANAPSVGEMELTFTQLEAGGTWRPSSCLARQRVALIVPFRDREEHLRIFLYHMHRLLSRQQLDYRILVIEQVS